MNQHRPGPEARMLFNTCTHEKTTKGKYYEACNSCLATRRLPQEHEYQQYWPWRPHGGVYLKDLTCPACDTILSCRACEQEINGRRVAQWGKGA